MFKIGDVVKIIKNSYSGHEFGSEGIISDTYQDDCYYVTGLSGEYIDRKLIHHHSDLSLSNYGGK